MVYLIPCTLGDTPINNVLPQQNAEVIRFLHIFVVENIRTARRFLKQVDRSIDIDKITFYELNQHTDFKELLLQMKDVWKEDIGVISEAGCPAVADPGALVVAEAQRRGIRVVPLVGPSSILMSLMASGFNGQNFAFNGYLPIDRNERIAKIKQLEKRADSERQTQIFIETPYRNLALMDDLCRTLQGATMLCVASGITTDAEWIRTKRVEEWRKGMKEIEKIQKIPTIFLLDSQKGK
ncbi:MAG: SAM-dependent methyltransferase [Paludibacteraceae bacterium]|nr:SAM-dependent methyltransferase [Paludibacteraceae bacterium]